MSQPLAQLERDAAIARVSRTRRWMMVGATALTAAFAAIISAVAPGRSFASHSTSATTVGARRVASTSPARSTSAAGSRASTKLPPLEGPQALGLGGPPQAPQASSSAGSSDQSQAAPSQSQVSPAQSQAPAPAQSSPPVVSGGS